MAKDFHNRYICSQCGNEYLQWSGRCQFCGAWNSIRAVKEAKEIGSTRRGEVKEVRNFSQIAGEPIFRLKSLIGEFDRVLGGGLVPGSVVLLGGDPGIGKSTLLLQVANAIAEQPERKVCYVSGEESLGQLKIRADRLGLGHSPIILFNETSLPDIIETVSQLSPSLLIIDSIQTVYQPDLPSLPGSANQVRDCSQSIIKYAKSKGVAVILVGHITKEGNVAGPKTLEHLVDVVLYLEGEKYHKIRILRGAKNRFGDTSESGLFTMTSTGMQEILNPSELFLSEKIQAPGSVITATIEGKRPILIEIQSLVKKTVFGYPQRTASGFDLNRLHLLLAVLDRRAGVDLSSDDVYVNIVGGVKVREPAVDLAVITALASAKKGIEIDPKLVVWGEVGLSGEIRRVIYEDERIAESKKLGYQPKAHSSTVRGHLKELVLI